MTDADLTHYKVVVDDDPTRQGEIIERVHADLYLIKFDDVNYLELWYAAEMIAKDQHGNKRWHFIEPS